MKAFCRSSRVSAVALTLVILAGEALAAGSGMPWERPVGMVETSITGPVLKAAVSMLVVAAGIATAMSSSAGVQKFTGLIFGGAIAGAFVLFLGIFNIGAGALI